MPSLRLTPVVIFVTLLLGIVLTLTTMRIEQRIVAAPFDRVADLVAGRLQQRMVQHIALLQATRSYVEAENGQVTPAEFADYVSDLGLARDFRGIQGIGFAPLLPAAEAARAADRIGRDQGVAGVTITPPTDQDRIGPIAMLEPQDDRNQHALGFDMFAEPLRRVAMTAALDSGEPRASAPVELVQEEVTSSKQSGFLIFLPTRLGLFDFRPVRDGGFIYAPFRAGDLHQAVLDEMPDLSLTLRTVDAQAPQIALFDTLDPNAQGAVSRDIDIAGRHWTLTLAPTEAFGEARDHSAGITVALLSLLLLGAVWGTIRAMRHAVLAAEQNAALSQRQSEERALLLREMQHRIKNHIARIQAIARQTIRGSDDLPAFERVFGARLSAMAKAQDALVQGAGDTADLRKLLRAELAQVLDLDAAEKALSGPEIRLNVKATHAMGLVAHELATNAMKYGTGGAARVAVSWRDVPRDDANWLELEWREPDSSPPPSVGDQRSGFGSQLIEALIKGDLEGSFERRFDADGMTVTIRFPLIDERAD